MYMNIIYVDSQINNDSNKSFNIIIFFRYILNVTNTRKILKHVPYRKNPLIVFVFLWLVFIIFT